MSRNECKPSECTRRAPAMIPRRRVFSHKYGTLTVKCLMDCYACGGEFWAIEGTIYQIERESPEEREQ